MWALLYAQAEQLDGTDRRNVLLGRKRAPWPREDFKLARASNAYGEASFTDGEFELSLKALGFAWTAPLSVLAVELLPQDTPAGDPLGADLGGQRNLAHLNAHAASGDLLKRCSTDQEHCVGGQRRDVNSERFPPK